MATGWSWEYVWETMTFQRLEVFTRIWKRSPPTHISLAKVSFMLQKFLGFTDPKDALDSPKTQPALATMSDIED